MEPQVSMVVSAAVLSLAGSVWGSALRQDETSPSASHSHTRMVRVCVLDWTGSPPSNTVMGRWYTLGNTQPLRRVSTLAELSDRVRQTESETERQKDRQGDKQAKNETNDEVYRQADRQEDRQGESETKRERDWQSETVTVVICEGEVGIILCFRSKCVTETLSSYWLVHIYSSYWLD